MNQEQLTIASPYVIQLNLLGACPLGCEYCYLKDYKKSSIPRKNLDILLDKLQNYNKRYGIEYHLNLTGGDIWLYSDIEYLLREIKERKEIISCSLLINSPWHSKSKDLISIVNEKLDAIQINLDEYKAKDSIFYNKLEIPIITKILLSKDTEYFNKQLALLRCLHKNSPEIFASVDRLCPTEKSMLEHRLDTKKLHTRLENLIKIVGKNSFLSDDPIINALMRRKTETHKNAEYGCGIPYGSLTIFPDSSIKLCARIPSFNTGFTIENLNLLEYIQQFNNKRQANIKKTCLNCNYYNECKGGCPAISYIETNQIFSKDPNCIKEYENSKI